MADIIANRFDNIPCRYNLENLPYDITKKELLKFFHLPREEINFINSKSRFYSYKIALGIQIGSYKIIGRFQQNLNLTPEPIIKFIAKKLSINILEYPFEYSKRAKTLSDHNRIIKEFLKVKSFSIFNHNELISYLTSNAPDPGHHPTWIKLAEDYLRAQNYILPSTKVLRRIIISARNLGLENVSDKIWVQISTKNIEDLNNLLIGGTNSKWNQYTNNRFYKATTKKLNEVLEVIQDIRDLSLNSISLSDIPSIYLKYFSQRGMQFSSKQLNDLSKKTRYVLMVVTLKHLTKELTDIPIQMNDEIISEVFLKGENKSKDFFKKNRKDVGKIISAFHFISETMLNSKLNPNEKLKVIGLKYPDKKLEELNKKSIYINIPRGVEKLYFASNSHQKIQKYLPQFLKTFKLSSLVKNDPVIKAAEYYLNRKKDGKIGIGEKAPCDFIVKKNWKKIVFDKNGKPKSKPWILCLADSIRSSFRKGAFKIEGTMQYKSLDSDLIPWKKFKALDIKEDKNFPFTSSADVVINSIGKAIQDLSSKEHKWKENNTASIDTENKIHFKKLDSLEEPDSVKNLRNILYGNLSPKSFSDVLIEADRLTGYTKQLTRLSSGQPIKSVETKLGTALYSVLYAAACNIPLTKMFASAGISLDFLTNIRDETIRTQTIQAAITDLVDFYSRLPLAQIWGSGTTSSSDGQGMVVEGNPLGARFNKKLFKKGTRGFIIYTHILDNYAPFFTQIFPAIPREAPYVADGLLYSGISLVPREHYTDTHGYTDIVFGILYLLGFRFCPRIANIPDASLWYLHDFSPIKLEIFSNKILLSSMTDQWESMQRLIYTIHSGEVRASQIIRKLSSFETNHPLYKAFRNFGRLCKTRHILEMAGDMTFRRQILQGLNKGESRNSFGNEVRFGSRGIFKEKDPELRVCMASATNLIILCAAVCNTIEMQQKIRSLKSEGYEINPDDLKFLSPFAHSHYNFLGHFDFSFIPHVNKNDIEKQFQPLF